MFSFLNHVSGQETTIESNSTGISFEFIKLDYELPVAESYFNVVRIKNNNNISFTGILTFKVPALWNLIGPSEIDIDLDAGEEIPVPMRVTMPPGTLGGISFMLTAELSAEQYYDYTTAYVSLKRRSKWDMIIDDSKIFVSDYKPRGDFSILLRNKGNSDEMIKMAFDMGALIELVDPLEADSLLFINMPAYMDTVLSFQVRERMDLRYAERQTHLNNWKSSSISLVSSTSEQKRYGAFRVFPLESNAGNNLPLRNSPLNIDLSLNNLLSYQKPKISTKIHGRILFPETQQIQYGVGISNLYFDRNMNKNLDIYQQLKYMIRYSDRSSQVLLSDRMGVGELHSLSGQGLQAQHSFADQHTVSLNVIQNPYSKNIGAFVGYNTVIKGISMNTGITMETKTNNRTSFYSYHLGASYKFLKHHTVRAQVITSLNKFSDNIYIDEDTTTIGFAYRMSYRYNSERFNFRIDNTNTRFSYLRNSGINRINLKGDYRINDKMLLDAIYYRNSYNANRYPYNFFFASNQNINDNGRLFVSYNSGKIIYRGGPQYSNSGRIYYNPSTGYTTSYSNIQPGLFGSISFRLGTLRSLSPFIAMSTMFVNYESDDADFEEFNGNGLLQYSMGMSYYDQAFKFNAYFTSGEASDLYRSVVVDREPVINQGFHIRPYYERYFNKQKVRMSVYLNYSYYLPSTRENTMLNLSSDFFMKDGWNTFLSFNLFRNVRSDDDVGRIATRDVNLLVGLRKAFDIQQPRLKYYDLTIAGFNDKNGNMVKDEDEKPISNVLINISRDSKKNLKQKTGFSEISLITDPQGEIFYESIPEGLYDLQITSLSNLEDLYFLNGENQILEVNADMVHYLPLVETYKVKGKVSMQRDPNSNEGRIVMEGIRVTAMSEDGETYSTLTNSYGGFILSLPKAAIYEVSVYNVFGEQFMLEQGRYRIQFTANKTVNVDFKFTEKRRQVQFNDGEQLFDFNISRDE